MLLINMSMYLLFCGIWCVLMCYVRRQVYLRRRVPLIGLYMWNLLHVFGAPIPLSEWNLSFFHTDLFGVLWATFLVGIFTFVTCDEPPHFLSMLLFLFYLTWGFGWVYLVENGTIQRQLWFPTGMVLAMWRCCLLEPVTKWSRPYQTPWMVRRQPSSQSDFEDGMSESSKV